MACENEDISHIVLSGEGKKDAGQKTISCFLENISIFWRILLDVFEKFVRKFRAFIGCFHMMYLHNYN